MDLNLFLVEGRGWRDTATPYDRLPARAKGKVPSAVWNLSHDSAGLCARLVTDASRLKVRWALRSDNLAMPHMPATGVSGVEIGVPKSAFIAAAPARPPERRRPLVFYGTSITQGGWLPLKNHCLRRPAVYFGHTT